MRLNVYDLISSIMISISVGRPKHRDGDVDTDYCPKTSMTFVPRHSPVTEFTVLLYPLWWRGRMQASYCCILQLDHTALHAQKTWTWPPVPARRRLPDDHPPHRPPCSSGAKVAGIDLTEMFEGTEYFQFGGSDVLATSSDDEHWKFDAFIKKNWSCVFFSWNLLKPTDNRNFETVWHSSASYFFIGYFFYYSAASCGNCSKLLDTRCDIHCCVDYLFEMNRIQIAVFFFECR